MKTRALLFICERDSQKNRNKTMRHNRTNEKCVSKAMFFTKEEEEEKQQPERKRERE